MGQKDLTSTIMKLVNYLLPLLLVASCSAFSFSSLFFGDQEAKIAEAVEQPAVGESVNEEPVEAAQPVQEESEQEENEEDDENDDNEEEEGDEEVEEEDADDE